MDIRKRHISAIVMKRPVSALPARAWLGTLFVDMLEKIPLHPKGGVIALEKHIKNAATARIGSNLLHTLS